MPYAAISYKVKPGFDEEIAHIFSPENFKRADSPVMRDGDGNVVGYLVSTGLFIEGDTMVRLIQHEGGTPDDVARHMSVQEGVHEAERELAPYLATPRDTTTPEGFVAHFERSRMRCLAQAAVDNRPSARLSAVRFRVRADRATGVAPALETWVAAHPALAPAEDGEPEVIALGWFLHTGDLVLAVQAEGGERAPDPTALGVPDGLQAALAPDAEGEATPAGRPMRCISHLSVASV